MATAQEPLLALDAARAILQEIAPRAEVFEKRARETDPDRKIYGPGMVQKVLAFCERLADAAQSADELEESLAPLRESVAARAAEQSASHRREAEEQERLRAEAQQAAEQLEAAALAAAAAERAAARGRAATRGTPRKHAAIREPPPVAW